MSDIDDKIKLVSISFHIPKQYIEYVEKLVRLGIFSCRAEAIREAVRTLIDQYSFLIKKDEDK